MVLKPVVQDLLALLSNVTTVAVVGASNAQEKYGFRVYQRTKQEGYTVYPVNPNQSQVQGDATFPDLAKLPLKPDLISVITPPAVSKDILQQSIKLHLPRIWFQPGAYDQELLNQAKAAPIQVIAGPCILVTLTIKHGLHRTSRI